MAKARFRFRVTGTDSVTRAERVVFVDAPDDASALSQANKQGMLAFLAEPAAQYIENETRRSKYEYRMAQVAIQVVVRKDHRSAASYLQNIVNKHAAEGWDFYRIDQFVVEEQPGCIGFLVGQNQTPLIYHIVTFRRERE